MISSQGPGSRPPARERSDDKVEKREVFTPVRACALGSTRRERLAVPDDRYWLAGGGPERHTFLRGKLAGVVCQQGQWRLPTCCPCAQFCTVAGAFGVGTWVGGPARAGRVSHTLSCRPYCPLRAPARHRGACGCGEHGTPHPSCALGDGTHLVNSQLSRAACVFRISDCLPLSDLRSPGLPTSISPCHGWGEI